MNINIDEITFIIVTHQSEKVIKNCLNSLPKNSKKIIVENSQNLKLKKSLEHNFDNIEVVISENLGMGGSNNIGIEKSKTKYAYVLNPDVRFKKDTVEVLFKYLKMLEKKLIIILSLNWIIDYLIKE